MMEIMILKVCLEKVMKCSRAFDFALCKIFNGPSAMGPASGDGTPEGVPTAVQVPPTVLEEAVTALETGGDVTMTGQTDDGLGDTERAIMAWRSGFAEENSNLLTAYPSRCVTICYSKVREVPLCVQQD